MTIRKLFEFIATLIEGGMAGEPIRARLVYRRADGVLDREEFAEIGYCSGLSPVLTIEMNSVMVSVPPCQCCGKPMLFRNEYRQGEQCRWCGTFTPDSR